MFIFSAENTAGWGVKKIKIFLLGGEISRCVTCPTFPLFFGRQKNPRNISHADLYATRHRFPAKTSGKRDECPNVAPELR